MISLRTLLPVLTKVTRRHFNIFAYKSSVSNRLHTKRPEVTLTGAPERNQEPSVAGQQQSDNKNSREITKEFPGDSENTHEQIAYNEQDHGSLSEVKDNILLRVTKSIDVAGLKPKLPTKSYTVVPYVNESETLSRLVNMGVNLTKTEQDTELGNFLLRTNFERDIQPILLFLMRDIGLNEQDIVKVLSSNLGLLKEHLDDLNARVNFLRYMKFSDKAIQTIVRRNANFLSYGTKDVDRACGFIQQLLALSGAERVVLLEDARWNETRALLTAYPSKKLIYGDFTHSQALVDMFQDIEGFSQREVKRMCLKYPRLLTYGHSQIARAIDYVTDEMSMARAEILACPYVFNPRGIKTVTTRHRYIKFIKRDQFNPKKANYVSLESLVDMEDGEFCEKVAKTPLQDFYDFQKTL